MKTKIMEILERFQDSNLASEGAREVIASEIEKAVKVEEFDIAENLKKQI